MVCALIWIALTFRITPSVYNGAANDEWHLCASLGKDKCLSRLQDHWRLVHDRHLS